MPIIIDIVILVFLQEILSSVALTLSRLNQVVSVTYMTVKQTGGSNMSHQPLAIKHTLL